MSAHVCRFLRFHGTLKTENTPKLAEVADAIYRYQKRPLFTGTKSQAKYLIRDFYEQIKRGDSQPKPRKGPHVFTQFFPGAITLPSVEDFYRSEQWRKLRYAALRNSKGVCELCGAAPSQGKPLHVDHIKPRSRYPEYALDPKNLQVLCDDCNLGKGNSDTIDWRRNGTIDR